MFTSYLVDTYVKLIGQYLVDTYVKFDCNKLFYKTVNASRVDISLNKSHFTTHNFINI